MKNIWALGSLLCLSLVACGENRSSETVSSAPVVAGATSSTGVVGGVSANDAIAASPVACGAVDLSVSADSQKMRFAANVPVACAAKVPVLLAKYASTVFPPLPGVACVLLRSQEEFAKYGDFTFRCTGSKIAFPAAGGEFAIELPAVKGLDPSAIKLRLIVE